MANTIQFKRSSVSGKLPNVSDLQVGEIALNLADGIIYSKNTTGNVIVVGSSTTSNVTEGANLYYTNARVYANVLSMGHATNAQLATYATNAQVASFATNAQLATYATNNQLSLYATNAQLINNYVRLINGEGFLPAPGGDEGGQINFANAVTNNSLSGNITMDIFQNKLRIFESSGTNRGVFVDLSSASAGVGTNLIGGGSGTITSVAGVSSGAVSNAQIAAGISNSGILTTANVSEVTNLYYSNARVYANVLSLGYATNAQLATYATNAQLTVAFNQSNTAFAQANVAFAQGNTNYGLAAGYANVAFAQANTAFAQANTSFAQANVAFLSANASFTAANTYVNTRLLTKANVSDLTTSNVTEGTNLYFNNTRAFAAVANTNIILANLTTTGNLTIGSAVGGNITGVNNLFVTNTYSNVIIANVWSGLFTSNVIESTGNIFFTNTRAVSALTPGTGISIAANGLITSTVTSISAGKVLAFALLFGM